MNRTPELNLRTYIDAPDTSCEARTAAHDDLSFLLAELARKNEALAFTSLTLRRPRMLLTGISSKAMLGYAIGGALPDPEWEYPRDTVGLARCVEVRRVAPAGLHARMDEVLALYRAAPGEQP